jgi:hypothetical protein
VESRHLDAIRNNLRLDRSSWFYKKDNEGKFSIASKDGEVCIGKGYNNEGMRRLQGRDPVDFVNAFVGYDDGRMYHMQFPGLYSQHPFWRLQRTDLSDYIPIAAKVQENVPLIRKTSVLGRIVPTEEFKKIARDIGFHANIDKKSGRTNLAGFCGEVLRATLQGGKYELRVAVGNLYGPNSNVVWDKAVIEHGSGVLVYGDVCLTVKPKYDSVHGIGREKSGKSDEEAVRSWRKKLGDGIDRVSMMVRNLLPEGNDSSIIVIK